MEAAGPARKPVSAFIIKSALRGKIFPQLDALVESASQRDHVLSQTANTIARTKRRITNDKGKPKND